MALSNPFSINNIHLLFCSALLFFLCYLNGAYVYAAKQPAGPYHEVNVNSLLPDPNCTAASTHGSKFGSQKLKVTYRYGACSPISPGKEILGSGQILLRDSLRVRSKNHRKNPKPHTNGPSIGGGDYLVTIGFGTPKQDRTVVIDTGSDITWVQCKPCSKKCYHQKEPLFDPSKSTSYSSGSCKSSEQNYYNMTYADESYSNGLYGCDTLTFEPSVVVNKFQFGCGQKSSSGFGGAAGLLGLGQGDLSFVSQTASQFGKVFSYCLPPKDGQIGYLLFGDEARSSSSSSSLKFTPLLKVEDPSLYSVKLVGMTVGSKRLNIPAYTFSSPGTIMDSGTVITRLPKLAYQELQSAFQEWMSKYPPAPRKGILNTCYNLKGYEKVTYPAIVFHFGGGTDVNLDQSGIIWVERKTQVVCLAFAAKEENDHWNIIGNHQQKALNLFYDIQGGRLGFGTQGCNK
uniref:Peptidase A1 domain-containing protein n=1 Tax=Davidia involucrata TaxID=16924 RepID=A0A5B7A1J7_DAVIN